MEKLPNDALVVRGGQNEPDNFAKGRDVVTDATGLLSRVSVQCASEKTVQELSLRILNGQIGVTTVGRVREAGGEVEPDPTSGNPYHCLLRGLDAETASGLFTPTMPNPRQVR